MTAADDFDRDGERRERQLETLDRLSQRFGTSLSGALGSGEAQGRQLAATLGQVADTLASALSTSAASTLQDGLMAATRSLSADLLASSFGGALPFARGGVISSGAVTPFAQGGIVAAPTYFPLGRGLGLMGEAGSEAVMPLARGPDGRLGVRSSGGGATNVTVNISATDAESFRRSETQVAAALARAVARGRRGL